MSEEQGLSRSSLTHSLAAVTTASASVSAAASVSVSVSAAGLGLVRLELSLEVIDARVSLLTHELLELPREASEAGGALAPVTCAHL